MARLGDLIEQIRGVSYKPEDVYDELNENSVVLLRANNIKEGLLNFDDVIYVDKKRVRDYQLLKAGDILICTSSGSKELVGKSAYVQENLPMTFGAFCKVVRPKKIRSEYLGHFFNSSNYRKKISDVSAGANIKNIRNEHIDELEILLPTIDKQEYVAVVLDMLTRLISLRKQQLAKLDELIKARFVEMFGDTLLNPFGWPEKQLESMADIVSGITKGRKTKSTELIEAPYMAVSNVKAGYIDWTTVKTIMATQSEIDQYRILPNDVLMTEGGDPDKLGRGAIIQAPLQNCIHQNHIFRVRLDRDTIFPEFFAEYLQHQKAKRYFLGCAKQTTGIASINMKQLRSLPVLLPPIDSQEIFSVFIGQVGQQKMTIQQSIDKLEALKKSLMQEYFG